MKHPAGTCVAVVGSRDFADLDRVRRFIATLPAGVVVLSGGARGVDRCAAGAARAVHKSDLEAELPSYREIPVPIQLGDEDPRAAELGVEYAALMRQLAKRIQQDLYTPLAGKLWGAISELPSYLDRATNDLRPFVVKYPDSVGGAVIATAKSFPAAWLTPKERWLVERLRQHLRDGRNVLVLLRHTGKSGLAQRYQRIFRLHLGERAIFLDAARVTAGDREDWLDTQIIRQGCRLLLTNPKAVQTARQPDGGQGQGQPLVRRRAPATPRVVGH